MAPEDDGSTPVRRGSHRVRVRGYAWVSVMFPLLYLQGRRKRSSYRV